MNWRIMMVYAGIVFFGVCFWWAVAVLAGLLF